jgi:hypothetical protein
MHKSGSTLSTIEELVFRSEDDYMQHMHQSHGDSLAKKQLLTLAQISQRPMTDVFKICWFCGGIPDDLETLKQDPNALQHALQKHVGTHLQSLAMISLPWDSSQPGSAVSSDAVQGDFDDKPDPKNKKSPSEGSDDGSESESDRFHNTTFIDPPPRTSNGADHDLIDYWKLESKAPGEPYEPDLMDDFSIAISVDPVWDTSRVLLGGREWEFMKDERPPYWKGELRYKHSSNSKLTSFISEWKSRAISRMESRRSFRSQIDDLLVEDGFDEEKWFLPKGCFSRLVTKARVRELLPSASRTLVKFVCNKARKIFLILM